ncbi:MAG: hypothetical protein K6G15_07840 [Desulfovibrio sp.]|nr:hypothetical protein [Desulfovibrio sp.]
MKFFNPGRTKFSVSRPKLFCVALCLALSMWYFVVYHATSEVEITLLINYQGQPKELYVTSGLIYTVKERVKGPKLLLDKLPESFPLPIDISSLKVGTNVFSVVDELKKIVTPSQNRAFKIQKMDPPLIRLHAEYIDSISVPVNVQFRSNNDLLVVAHKVSQNSVVFKGPENEIRKLKQLASLPLDVRVDLADMGKGIVAKDIPVEISTEDYPHVTISPPSVRVSYEVMGERVEVVRAYDITLAVTDASLYSMSPNQVTLRLKVPDYKQRDTEYLKSLRVTALPPDMQEDESRRVRLDFTPPEGMEIVSSDKEWIIITRLRGDQIKEMRHPQPLPHDQHEEKKLETKPKRKKHMAHPKEQIPSPREKREQKK